MRKDKKKLIELNQVDELSSLTFNQHMDNSSEQGYTEPLSNEEELSVVRQLLSTRNPQWFNFLRQYFQHYPMLNESTVLLIDSALTDSNITDLLVANMQRYGCDPEQATKLCQAFLTNNTIFPDLLSIICKTSRIHSQSVKMLLERLENREREKHPDCQNPQYVELYEKSITEYRNFRS